jgi:hypothetical protein
MGSTARPSFELQLRLLIEALRKQHAGDGVSRRLRAADNLLVDVILPRMEALVAAFVRDNLETTSDVVYNPDLAKSLVALEDFDDLLAGRFDEYAIRKHMRSIIRMYMGETNRAHPIKITDRAKFGIHMETIGLNIGWSNDTLGASRSLLPDGNVVVLALLTLAVAVLAFKRK